MKANSPTPRSASSAPIGQELAAAGVGVCCGGGVGIMLCSGVGVGEPVVCGVACGVPSGVGVWESAHGRSALVTFFTFVSP